MAIERGITHGVKYQTRTISAYPANGSFQRWIVGTNALREENEVGGWHCGLYQAFYGDLNSYERCSSMAQVQIIDYDPETSKITTAEVYTHGPEVWQVSPSPAAAQTLATIYNQGNLHAIFLYQS